MNFEILPIFLLCDYLNIYEKAGCNAWHPKKFSIRPARNKVIFIKWLNQHLKINKVEGAGRGVGSEVFFNTTKRFSSMT